TRARGSDKSTEVSTTYVLVAVDGAAAGRVERAADRLVDAMSTLPAHACGRYACLRWADRDRAQTRRSRCRCRPPAQSCRSIWWASRTRTGVLRHTRR